MSTQSRGIDIALQLTAWTVISSSFALLPLPRLISFDDPAVAAGDGTFAGSAGALSLAARRSSTASKIDNNLC